MPQEKDGREEEGRMEAAERPGEERPERWSARAKAEIVLRLLKGEELDTVSRETQVPVHELEGWRADLPRGRDQRLQAARNMMSAMPSFPPFQVLESDRLHCPSPLTTDSALADDPPSGGVL